MTEFKDSTGQTWSIVVNLGSAKRVLEEVGVDLLNPTAMVKIDENGEIDELNSLTTRLSTDDILVGKIVASIIKKQAVERGINEDDLLDIFDGSTFKEAQLAFLKEYNAFFTDRGNYPMKAMTTALMDSLKTLETGKVQKKAKSASAGETL